MAENTPLECGVRSMLRGTRLHCLLNRKRDAKDGPAFAYNVAALVSNRSGVTVNKLSHYPESKSVPLRFVAFEGIE